MLIPIILGSSSDLKHGRNIYNQLDSYGINSIIRICSAHKSPHKLLSMLEEYENDSEVIVIVTIAGKSNALSALVDGNITTPVISCPPIKHETIYDLYSSISMPSDIAPLLILNTKNAVMAILKICGVVNPKYKQIVKEIHINNKNKLKIDDLKEKYFYNKINNEELSNCLENSMNIMSSFYPIKKLVKQGKIRDIYSHENDNWLCLMATDRLSGFDRILSNIPYKGKVLNSVSKWWFDKTKHIVPNHIIDASYDRLSIVQKCTVFPIEFVVRSYMTGSTNTSIWQNYKKGLRNYCGHILRDGYKKNDKLDDVIVTPTTKSDINDELISEKEIINNNIMSQLHWNMCKSYALRLFKYGQKVCEEKGLILVDTKYEFGLDYKGNVLLIDEIHTPDSSRYWIKHNYDERINSGLEPDHIDKEFIRKWVKNKYNDPYNIDHIDIPDDMRIQLSNKYLLLEELITG